MSIFPDHFGVDIEEVTHLHSGAPETTKGRGAASYLRAISGVVAGGTTPLNFGLSENLLVINFSSKNANFEAEKLLLWGNLGSKLKF